MTEIIKHVTNKNFDKALAYVQETSPHLFYPRLVSIEFGNYNEGWMGLHITQIDIETELPASKIKIRNGRYEVWEFVNTLIHELTHCYQYHHGRDMGKDEKNVEMFEREAEVCGYLAEKQYKKAHGIPDFR